MVVQVVKLQTFDDLMEDGGVAQLMGEPETIILTILNDGVQRKGAFKVAYKATCKPSILGNKPVVCAKQMYMREYENGVHVMKILEFAEQKQMFSTELGILVWAHALLDYVYRLLELDHNQPKHPIEIPQFRFVTAALATEGREVAEEKRKVYLLEEFIEGSFVKYVNNGCAVPLANLVDEDYRRAQFLCFTQHVQYVMTGKMAFIGDYQGISLPQISISAVDNENRCRLAANGPPSLDKWVCLTCGQ